MSQHKNSPSSKSPKGLSPQNNSQENGTITAFVINLDSAKDRWTHIEASFAKTQFQLQRVPAVDGNLISLPAKDYAESCFRRFHGRGTNPYEVACYWSHVKAIQAFLETGDEYGLICEDDIVLGPELDAVVAEAVRLGRYWNVLRLTGLSNGKAVKLKNLHENYFLSIHAGRLKGAGAYIVDRQAAEAYAKRLLPMWLPFDHAVDREWFFGLSAASITPFPISQTDGKFRTSIQRHSAAKLTRWQRWASIYPYQAFNEITRWAFRAGHIASLSVRLSRVFQPQ